MSRKMTRIVIRSQLINSTCYLRVSFTLRNGQDRPRLHRICPAYRNQLSFQWITYRHRRKSHGFVFKRHKNDGRPAASHAAGHYYYAEHQITASLPKLIEKATNRDLTQGLKAHLEETKKQIERLDQVFKKLGKPSQGTQCPAIDGLIREADDVAGEVEDKQVLDAAIVAAAQAVEHYEIARYGTLIAWGGRARPRRYRPFPHHESERKKVDRKPEQQVRSARELIGARLARRSRQSIDQYLVASRAQERGVSSGPCIEVPSDYIAFPHDFCEAGSMLGWFRALMPREERFFDLFSRHAEVTHAGAVALRELLNGNGDVVERCKEISRREAEADEIPVRSLLRCGEHLSRHSIAATLRICITSMERRHRPDETRLPRVITLFELRSFRQPMQDMGRDHAVRTAGLSPWRRGFAFGARSTRNRGRPGRVQPREIIRPRRGGG